MANAGNDREFSFPQWKENLNRLNQRFTIKDVAYDDTKDYFIEEQEIALKHPTKGSTVKLTDEGYIDLFAGPSVGIRIDPETNSINLYGDNINLVGKSINMVTKTNQLAWNGHYFNPDLYMENDTEKEQVLLGTKNYWVFSKELGWHWERRESNIRPMLSTPNKRRYSEGMTQLLKDMGLPTE